MTVATDVLTNLLANKFIQRKDVKAVQRGTAYIPVTDRQDNRLPWTRENLADHVTGRNSFGHYLVDGAGKTKLFAFDIDLTKWSEKSGRAQPMWLPIDENGRTLNVEPRPLDPRQAWLHPKRPSELERYLIAQMRGVAELLANVTVDLIGVPVAVSYSGNKGMHVYGFTGEVLAHDARGAAMEVVNYAGCFEPLRGKNFFKHENESPQTGFGCIDLEVFPKQDDLDGKDLGNLMRLPLGVHKKSGHKSHFVNLCSDIDSMPEMDPILALESGDPWQV